MTSCNKGTGDDFRLEFTDFKNKVYVLPVTLTQCSYKMIDKTVWCTARLSVGITRQGIDSMAIWRTIYFIWGLQWQIEAGYCCSSVAEGVMAGLRAVGWWRLTTMRWCSLARFDSCHSSGSGWQLGQMTPGGACRRKWFKNACGDDRGLFNGSRQSD